MFPLLGPRPLLATLALAAALLDFGDSQVAAAATRPLPRRNNSAGEPARWYGPPRYMGHGVRVEAVKQAFQISWDGYYKYAFPHDSLRPVTNSFYDDRNGWGASAVDALSTALVMGNHRVVEQILDYIPTIDFDYTEDEVSLFETTIRYLGGLISAYDLMTSNATSKRYESSKANAVLRQAVRLADNLKVAFDTPTGIPDNSLLFNPPRRSGSPTNSLATIGTLVLEWTRLSDITGNPTYGSLAQRAETYLLSPRPALTAEPFPGLLGTEVSLTTGNFLDGRGGWGGGDDSFYEYLLKTYLYDPSRFAQYKHRWLLAADSSIRYLTSHPTSRPDLTFLAMWDGRSLDFVSEHLACFSAGNFILGGISLDRPDLVTFGLDLVNSCHSTYTSTSSHLGPEVFRWQDARYPPQYQVPVPDNQTEFYEKSGFWIQYSSYVLRPEVIESYYYAYRATGNEKYREWAWEAFVAINRVCRIGSGYSGVADVNTRWGRGGRKGGFDGGGGGGESGGPLEGGGYLDDQETFWFAEVLKYLYAIFADGGEEWQVERDGRGLWVWNTEAHPVRVPGR